MSRDDSLSRRKVVYCTGIVAGAAALAGCGVPGASPDEETPDVPEEGGPDAGDEPDHAVDEEAWGDVDEIRLEGYHDAWEGIVPEAIAGEINPTLLLEAGREYEITFENADGEPHNLELWTDPEESLLSTDVVEDEGEAETLQFEASQEMDRYVCGVHDEVMQGMILFREDGTAG